MGGNKLYGYSQVAGITLGVLEMVLGLVVLLAHVPQFTEDIPVAIISTGLWAGALVSVFINEYYILYEQCEYNNQTLNKINTFSLLHCYLIENKIGKSD